MGTDSVETLVTGFNRNAVKVHSEMCNKLMILVSRISKTLPEIEAARPRCSSGIQALCLLSRAVERANLLIHYCTDSSKLYSAITGNAIVSRFRRSRDLLQQSLIQIENMVPLHLAIKISHIIDELRNTQFVLGAEEEEAGRVILALVQNSPLPSLDTVEDRELDALKLVAPLLRIQTPRGVLMEKRCISKLIQKVGDHTSTKWKVLAYLLHLLNKFGRSLSMDDSDTESEEHSPFSASGDPISSPSWSPQFVYSINHLPPCSSSRSNGHTSVRDDLSDVSSRRSSDTSYGLDFPKSLDGCDSPNLRSSNRGDEDQLSLSGISALPWESQCKAVEEVHGSVLFDSDSCHSVSHSDFADPLLCFLRSARDRHDPVAQATALKLLLALLTHNWVEWRRIGEEGVALLASFLESELGELALSVIEALCGQKDCRASVAGSGVLLESILKRLDNPEAGEELLGKMVKVVRDLSWDSGARYLIVDMGFVPALVRLMQYQDDDGSGDGGGGSVVAEYCLVVMRNVCETEKGRSCVADTEGCIAAISRRLESEEDEVEENVVMVLLSLCTHRASYCRLVMEEGVIPGLVSMSVNGRDQGKVAAGELLRILRDIDYSEAPVGRWEEEMKQVEEEEMVKSHVEEKNKRKKMGFFKRLWSPKAAMTSIFYT